MDETILKALCEPKRFLLLQLMAKRGYCVGALARLSQLSESAVSQHLKILRQAGLVVGVKRGYYTHYSLDKEALNAVIGQLEQLRDAQSIPCTKPNYGCDQAEYLQCRTSIPNAERKKDP